MRYVLRQEVLDKLLERKPGGVCAAGVLAEYNALILTLGMGPAVYLTLDGRVLIDERWWFGDDVREATEDEAISGIVVGAKVTGIQELLELVPPRPPEADACGQCSGARWWTLPVKDVHGNTCEIVCSACWGRGWSVQRRNTPDEGAETDRRPRR